MIPVLILLGFLVLLGLIFIGLYNRMVRLRQNVRAAWSAIETELRRRYDLIPNLVETVKGYASHERQTLESVVAARNAALANNGSPAQQAATETQLNGAVRGLLALAESYPDLKANQNFRDLQAQLSETENRLAQSRRAYNDGVRDLNTAIQTFPGALFAGAMGFQSEAYFEIEDSAARAPVQVKF